MATFINGDQGDAKRPRMTTSLQQRPLQEGREHRNPDASKSFKASDVLRDEGGRQK